jgi:cardiolipin synthase
VARQFQLLADQAFARTAGAPLVGGNAVRLLKDGSENYPAWLDAIRSAQRWIHFETYILHDDAIGKVFAEALCERARAGVRVRLLVDWLGSLLKSSPGFWRTFARAGVDARSFGYPTVDSPLGWISRDHRKSLVVDGRVAFVSGLCVGDGWLANPKTGREAQRDTGVMITGPAVADVETAFAEAWSTTGTRIPDAEIPTHANIAPAGNVALRVIATMPATAGVFKLDQLVASVARETLWITDAYFVGVSAYIRALIAAAQDGVDVRLLVPGTVDVLGVGAMSRSGYRALLEGGVRIFEWNGSMVHAKTAVADGKWARVGSSNLNITSWFGNWELDVAIEDEKFGRQMMAMYEQDLQNATEIVLRSRKVLALSEKHRVEGHSVERRRSPRMEDWRTRGRSTRRAAAAGAIRMGRTLGAALTSRREMGPAEAISLFWSSLLFLGLGLLALLVPKAISVPLGVLAVWSAVAGLFQSWRLYGRERSADAPRAKAESVDRVEVKRKIPQSRTRRHA